MYNKMTDQALPESEEGMPYITDTSLSLIKLQRRREEKQGGSSAGARKSCCIQKHRLRTAREMNESFMS